MNILKAFDVAKECGLETVGEAILNIDMHAIQIFDLDTIDMERSQLNGEWGTIRENSNFTLESSIIDVELWLKNHDGPFHDRIGGVHDEGVGWNPNGSFCGECGNISCEGCKIADKISTRVRTNFGDKIRSMSNEELAEWIFTHDEKTEKSGRWTKEQILEFINHFVD